MCCSFELMLKCNRVDRKNGNFFARYCITYLVYLSYQRRDYVTRNTALPFWPPRKRHSKVVYNYRGNLNQPLRHLEWTRPWRHDSILFPGQGWVSLIQSKDSYALEWIEDEASTTDGPRGLGSPTPRINSLEVITPRGKTSHLKNKEQRNTTVHFRTRVHSVAD